MNEGHMHITHMLPEDIPTAEATSTMMQNEIQQT